MSKYPNDSKDGLLGIQCGPAITPHVYIPMLVTLTYFYVRLGRVGPHWPQQQYDLYVGGVCLHRIVILLTFPVCLWCCCGVVVALHSGYECIVASL